MENVGRIDLIRSILFKGIIIFIFIILITIGYISYYPGLALEKVENGEPIILVSFFIILIFGFLILFFYPTPSPVYITKNPQQQIYLPRELNHQKHSPF